MARTKAFDEQLILEKAMDLFWANGYFNTSMQGLVDHLGINRGSIYDTYGGKKELFERAFDHYRKTNLTKLKLYFDSHNDVKEGFHNLFERAIDESACDAMRKGCFVINTLSEFVPSDKEIMAQINQNNASVKATFASFIDKGKQNGSVKKSIDTNTAVTLFFTLYNGIRVITKMDQDKSELMKSVEAALEIL